MRFISTSLFSILILIFNLFAQPAKTLNEIKRQYESFEYQNVINLSNELLKYADSLNSKELVELYTMKAISHYSLAEESQTRIDFINILKIDKEIELDSVSISPKILALFKNVKTEYLQSIKPKNPLESEKNSQEKIDPLSIEKFNKIKNDYRNSFVKSILLPGWGQISNGYSVKGYLMLSLSSLTLTSMIYFIFDSINKEKIYLSENDELKIKSSYDKYNTSYKIRNSLIITYSAIWIYSLIDILFLSESNDNNNLTFYPTFTPNSNLNLSFKLKF